MIHKFRKLLIQIGKILPFVVCFVVLANWAESMFALATNDFVEWNGVAILNTPIAFYVGSYFEYNIQMLAVLAIISIAIETCIYNKLTCLYLGINLLEKSYFDFELEPTYIYIICAANIIVAGYLTYKGARILLTKQ